MQIIKKYMSIIFLNILVLIMLAIQVSAQFFYVDNVPQILEKRNQDISELFSSAVATPTLTNEYFTHVLPSGMQVFAIDKNNFKLRYQQLFFEVHTFTSKIDTQQYAKSKYTTEQRYVLPVQNSQVFFYVKEVEDEIIQLAMYSNGVEVVVNTSSQLLEQALLKSAEIIRGTTVLETETNSIYIGGNNEQQQNKPSTNDGVVDESTRNNNNELPVVKE